MNPLAQLLPGNGNLEIAQTVQITAVRLKLISGDLTGLNNEGILTKTLLST